MALSIELFRELKPDITQVVTKLFEISKILLEKDGYFLPHGAILKKNGKLELIVAASENETELVNSMEILPLLYDGLRIKIAEEESIALGVAENLNVTIEGKGPISAIKVLFEHRRGLTLAVYFPFEKVEISDYIYDESFTIEVSPEVDAWKK
jgi:hypothetical protein